MMRKILIIAGEASGDNLGADLMAQFKDTEWIGIGGPKMQKQGLTPLYPMENITVMGLLEVIPKIFKIKQGLNQVCQALKTETFDAVITIDAQDFSKRVAKLAKRIQPDAKRIHYVTPKVWAWRASRAKAYAALYHKLLTVLPFECAYFTKYGADCTYVGHPVLTRLGAYIPQHVQPPKGQMLALMVGSRKQEILRHWPLMKDVFLQLQTKNPKVTAVVPLVNEKDAALLEDIPEGMEIISGEARYSALQSCRAAVSKSGTGNLELAVLGVPMVVGYKMNRLTYALLKYVVRLKLPYVSLVNWVAGRKVVPELLQNAFCTHEILTELQPLLANDTVWMTQAQALASVRKKLADRDKPAMRAAETILDIL